MCAAAELEEAKHRRSVSPGIADENAIFDQDMELDDGSWDADGMDTEEPESEPEIESSSKFKVEHSTEALLYGRQLRMDYPSDEGGGDLKMLDDIASLLAYTTSNSLNGHLLDPAGRAVVAEELNSAILGKLTRYKITFVNCTDMSSLPGEILFRCPRAVVPANRGPG